VLAPVVDQCLELKFLGPEYGRMEAEESVADLPPTEPEPQQKLEFAAVSTVEDAPTCSVCGSIMTRNGTCYKCGNCGATSGCS